MFFRAKGMCCSEDEGKEGGIGKGNGGKTWEEREPRAGR